MTKHANDNCQITDEAIAAGFAWAQSASHAQGRLSAAAHLLKDILEPRADHHQHALDAPVPLLTHHPQPETKGYLSHG